MYVLYIVRIEQGNQYHWLEYHGLKILKVRWRKPPVAIVNKKWLAGEEKGNLVQRRQFEKL